MKNINNAEWEIVQYNPSEMTEDKIREFYEFYLERQKEVAPMIPAKSFEGYIRDFRYAYPTDLQFYFMAKAHGKLIGNANVSLTKPSEEVPIEIKEKSWVNINIRKKWRNKGIGTALLETIHKKVSEYPIKKMNIWSSRESGKAFCKKFGGEITDKSYFNFLNLSQIDWSKIEEINESLSKKTSEISIEITDGLKQEDRNIYIDLTADFLEEISKYSDDWNFDREFFIIEFPMNEKRKKEKGEISIIAYAKNADGVIAGMSELQYDPAIPKEIYTALSGTVKGFRKKGLCKRMKTELLLFVKNNYPNVSIMTTANDEDNSVMRGINDQLGFESLPVSYGYSFELEELKKRFL